MNITRKDERSQLENISFSPRFAVDMLITITPDGYICDMNETAELGNGILREKLIGTKFSKLFMEPLITDYPEAIMFRFYKKL